MKKCRICDAPFVPRTYQATTCSQTCSRKKQLLDNLAYKRRRYHSDKAYRDKILARGSERHAAKPAVRERRRLREACAARTPLPVITVVSCGSCGGRFVPVGCRKVYCSPECGRRADKARLTAYRRSPEGRRKNLDFMKGAIPRERNRERMRRLYDSMQLLSVAARLEAIMRDVAGKGSELSGFAAGVKSMTTEQLKAEFAEGLRVTRERFLRLGAVLVELESRGETVEGDKYLIRLLRKIGLGELSVDVVVRFAGRPYTLASIITKSKPEEQDSIMAMTDNEVEEKYVGPRSERGGGKRRHRQHERQGDYGQVAPPSPEEMAANASVGDVAEMCLRIVNAAADPVAVAERLLPRLQEIKQKPRPRKHSFSDE